MEFVLVMSLEGSNHSSNESSENSSLFKSWLFWVGLILILMGLVNFIALPAYSRWRIHQSVENVFESKVKPMMPDAFHLLKNDPNDWTICTDMSLSVVGINVPRNMAAWIAFFSVGKRYCSHWWSFSGSPCDYYKSKRVWAKVNDSLERKIAMCEIGLSLPQHKEG